VEKDREEEGRQKVLKKSGKETTTKNDEERKKMPIEFMGKDRMSGKKGGGKRRERIE